MIMNRSECLEGSKNSLLRDCILRKLNYKSLSSAFERKRGCTALMMEAAEFNDILRRT
jgi:hypothetical protein